MNILTRQPADMIYSDADFANNVLALLVGKGYQVHEDTGPNFWFTWSHPVVNTGIETGPTHHDETSAWLDAAQHYFANTDIETFSVDETTA